MSPERPAGAAARWAVAALSCLAVLGAVLLVVAPVTASASQSPLTVVAALVSTGALVAAASLAVSEGPLRRSAAVTAAIAATSAMPVMIGWQTGPEAIRAAAVVLAPFLAPLLLDLSMFAPGAGPGRWRWGITSAAYIVTAICTAAIVLTRDPFVQAVCPADCTVRLLALAPDTAMAGVAESVWRAAIVAMALAAVIVTIGRMRDAKSAWASAAAIGIPASMALVVVAGSASSTTDPAFRPNSLLMGVALLALALGVSWTAWLPRRRRAAVRSLATRLDAAPAPGVLRDSLQRRLGDGDLELAYRLPGSDRLVDLFGRDVAVGVQPGRTTVGLERGDDLVAVVDVDSRLIERDDLLRAIGATARVAIDNERFAVALNAQYEDLARSRRRTVQLADETRRSIERDLHDGAQAELVGLLYELTRLRAEAVRRGEPAMADRIAEDAGQVSLMATRLRDLSHGIYPAVLEASGLEAALWFLTDQAAVPVTISVEAPGTRCAPAARVAYLLVAEAVRCAPGSGGTALTVEATESDGALNVSIRGFQARPPIRLEDRVGALEGTLTWDDDGWRAVLPCGS